MDTHELVSILQNQTKKRAATESLRQPPTKKVTETVKDLKPTKITRRGTDNIKRSQNKREHTQNNAARRTTRAHANTQTQNTMTLWPTGKRRVEYLRQTARSLVSWHKLKGRH